MSTRKAMQNNAKQCTAIQRNEKQCKAMQSNANRATQCKQPSQKSNIPNQESRIKNQNPNALSKEKQSRAKLQQRLHVTPFALLWEETFEVPSLMHFQCF